MVLLILIIFIFAASAFTEADLTQEIEEETIVNSSYNNTSSQVGDFNNTNDRSAGQVSIPLEKPSFID